MRGVVRAHARLAMALAAAATAVYGAGALLPRTAAADGRSPAGELADAGAASRRSATGSPYAQRCREGNARYAAGDFAAAIALYRNALELDPGQPAAHYLLGEAALAAGDVTGAEASWASALALADDRDPAMRGRILFVLADLKERQWRWDEATRAWQAYADWAARFPDAGAHPGSAESRKQVIAAMIEQDKLYEAVRRRIAGRDGGAPADAAR
jgi:tetratricopeptide (TPR) repeat protein